MNNLVCTVAATALLVVPVAGRTDEAPATLENGLQRVPDAKIKLAYVRPGTDWRKYKSILLYPLNIPPTARDTAPPRARPDFGESYLLGDKEITAIQELYDEAVRDELRRAGFTLVTTPQSDTLVVAVHVMKIVLQAPIESTRRDFANRTATFTNGGGASITIGAVLADGASRQVVAEVVDQKYGSDRWQMSGRTRNLADAKRSFREWARALAERLTRG